MANNQLRSCNVFSKNITKLYHFGHLRIRIKPQVDAGKFRKYKSILSETQSNSSPSGNRPIDSGLSLNTNRIKGTLRTNTSKPAKRYVARQPKFCAIMPTSGWMTMLPILAPAVVMPSAVPHFRINHLDNNVNAAMALLKPPARPAIRKKRTKTRGCWIN